MPRENDPGDAGAAVFADAGTSRAVIDATKHQGLASLSGQAAGRCLWDAFALSDEQLAGVLGGRVHPEAGQWLASWNELHRDPIS